jgi:hypothetical protein
MTKKIFDMGFVIADVGPTLPNAVPVGDQRLVFELLKRHLCLEVSAVVMIDLDQGIRALTDPVRPRQPCGVIAVFLYISPVQQLFLLQAQVHSPQSRRLSYSSLVIFFSRPCRV